MSESFVGHGLKTIWTEHDLEVLYRACLTIGLKRWELFEQRAVISLLQQQLGSAPPGSRGFNFDTPPAEFTVPEGRQFFAMLIQTVAQELAMTDPRNALIGAGWTRDNRLQWLARLGEMHEMLERTSPAGEIPPYQVMLSDKDEAECQIFLILSYLEQVNQNPNATVPQRLAFIDTLLNMLHDARLEEEKAGLCRDLQQARANLERRHR